MATYTAYIKGHHDYKTGRGAGAYIILNKETGKKYKSGVKKFPSTFNQHQIEFVCALSVAVSLCPSDSVIIQSNNQYVVNALTKDEVSADAANARLIDRYKEASMALNAELKWVKKDDNDLFAQICDAMAETLMEQD